LTEKVLLAFSVELTCMAVCHRTLSNDAWPKISTQKYTGLGDARYDTVTVPHLGTKVEGWTMQETIMQAKQTRH